MGEILLRHLADRDLNALYYAVAWAKRSGLTRLERGLREFRERGGRVVGIVGIDENGATRQGLELASSLADELYIFNDPSGGTFHPKLYVLSGEAKAIVLSGSANLTRGGLYDNYEVTTELELLLPADKAALDEYDTFFRELRDEGELCLRATPDLIARLVADGLARDEDARSDRPAADKTSGAERPESPFGRGKKAHVSAPSDTATPARPAERRPSRELREWAPAYDATPATAAPTRAANPVAPSAAAAEVTVEHRWYRQLDRASAQQPANPRTAVVGVLRLAKAGHQIDHRTYFRRELFGSARWTRTTVSAQPAEETNIAADVSINGKDLGKITLRVDHAEHRIADQGNVPTLLHWGSLGQTLRDTSYAGDYVLIEARSDGTFRLSIQPDEPTDPVM
jgi:hypothetical protein